MTLRVAPKDENGEPRDATARVTSSNLGMNRIRCQWDVGAGLWGAETSFRPRGCTRESPRQVDRAVGRTRHSIHLLADAPAREEPRPSHDVVDGRCNGR